MKVLLVSPLPPPSGGIATWTEKYIQYSKEIGIEVEVLNSAISKKRSQNIKRKRNLIDEIIRSGKIFFQLNKLNRKFNPDIIHISSSCSNWGLIRDWLCVRCIKKKSIIFHCHCNIEDQVNSSVGRFLLKHIAKLVSKIIVLNRSSYRFVEKYTESKPVIVPNFIENPDLIQIIKINKTVNKIVFVGHVKLLKGIKEILVLAKSFPLIDFLIVGPVQELPDNIEVTPNIKLLGEQPHRKVLDIMAQSDIFLFPSYTEGFSYAMLEAMAVGLPIIATNVGANQDMIEKKGGIIVGVANLSQLKKAIQDLYNPVIRQKMSEWNRIKVKEYYEIRHVIKQIYRIYFDVLK